MPSDMIIRNPSEMKKFADQIEDYCTAVRLVCRDLEAALEDAVPGMKDKRSRDALLRLQYLVNELQSGLPAAEGVAKKLRNSANVLEQAITE